jgi:hypothetical protein
MTNPNEPAQSGASAAPAGPGAAAGDAVSGATAGGTPAGLVTSAEVGGSAPLAPSVGETSMIARGVALLTPVFAVVAGWLAGVVAKVVPGAHLNRTDVTAFMIAAATAAVSAAWKWLQGWQQHERLVAAGQAKRVGKAP